MSYDVKNDAKGHSRSHSQWVVPLTKDKVSPGHSYGGNQVLVYISRVSVSAYDNKLLNTSTSTLGNSWLG